MDRHYVDAQDYFHNQRDRQIFDNYIYDLTYLKMSEVSIGYNIPFYKFAFGRQIQSATFSIVARNPWLIYVKNKDFDPSELSNTFSEDAQFPGTRSIGVNLKVGF